jgi:hypothetical protein
MNDAAPGPSWRDRLLLTLVLVAGLALFVVAVVGIWPT